MCNGSGFCSGNPEKPISNSNTPANYNCKMYNTGNKKLTPSLPPHRNKTKPTTQYNSVQWVLIPLSCSLRTAFLLEYIVQGLSTYTHKHLIWSHAGHVPLLFTATLSPYGLPHTPHRAPPYHCVPLPAYSALNSTNHKSVLAGSLSLSSRCAGNRMMTMMTVMTVFEGCD